MIESIIKKTTIEALKTLGFSESLSEDSITLEHPANLTNGDYSTNVAFSSLRFLAEKINKNTGGQIHTGDIPWARFGPEPLSPRKLAENISERIKKILPAEIEKVEVAGPGFINFYLSPKFFTDSLKEILKKGDVFGQGEKYDGKMVLVEYTDPNAFKVFHIGHLMSNAIGEAISRIIEFSGAKVVRICYPSDIGLHIAKAVWAMNKKEKELPVETAPIGVKTDFLGKCYVFGTDEYDKRPESKKEIDEINQVLFTGANGEIKRLYQMGRGWSLLHFDEIYKKLGTKFDKYIYESEVGSRGVEIVQKFAKEGVFEKSDGAIIFRGEKFGLHTRVFINSLGFPVYEAKDVGLNVTKFDLYPDATESIIITGNEQDDYFKVLIKALEQIDKKIGERTKHFGHGMLRFADGKMSSRTGKVITGESLLSDVKKLVEEKIATKDFSVEEKSKIAEAVAVGAIKYSVLRQSKNSNIVYDFEKSISFDGDSGPYLQYSYARAMSVLRKAGKVESLKLKVESGAEEISDLERMLYRFEEVVERSADEHEPHYIVTYLTELSGAFNAFYANNPILDAGEKTDYRLALTRVFTIVMKNGLTLLAIPVLEKM